MTAVVGVSLALAAAGCSSPTDAAGGAADVRGTWQYSGQQSAPSLQLTGRLVIAFQDGALLTGSLSWEERDGSGGTRLRAGAVSGRVIERSDIDFDVLLADGTRRHVARLGDGSMDGAWVQIETGRSGQFVAVRSTP